MGFTSFRTDWRRGPEVWVYSDWDACALSALLEVEETDGEVVIVRGSALLAYQAQTALMWE